jgi:signal transduction histidine kinase
MPETRNVDSRQEALAEMGEIAGRMVHEIRNPLNAIRMQVAVIRNKLANPEPENLRIARSQLDRLEQEVLRVERLAKAFLEFGRPPADEPEEMRPVEVVEDVASLLRPEFEDRQHRLLVQYRPDAADLRIRVDRAKFRQVIMNLLTNARRAMTLPGQAIVRVQRHHEHHVSIQVCDSGCGIAPEDMPNIFVPFYSTHSEGEGLGLAIVKRILESAGGSLRVESKEGQGSCFEIILPLCESD